MRYNTISRSLCAGVTLVVAGLLLPAAVAAGGPYGDPAALEKALADLRSVAESGGWPEVPDGPVLSPGTSGERVATLRQRLAASGDLDAAGDSDAYDDAVEKAVRRFQRRHGLAVDGLAGPNTLAALNVPASKRVAQIEANLARRKQAISDERYVLVNIPDQRLALVEGDSAPLTMKVVVGQEAWDTPSMSDTIDYLVLNPDWDVPPEIVASELLPKLKNDPGYLEANNMVLLDGWGEDAKKVDPSTVDFSSFEGEDFPYHLRQLPGPQNPLGQLKFMFPNDDDIYLHDTPQESLFGQAERAVSHGCVRLEKPFELAGQLLEGTEGWDQAELEKKLGGEQQRIDLAQSAPVHLVYWTAWVDGEGTLQLREDIYGRDAGGGESGSKEGS